MAISTDLSPQSMEMICCVDISLKERITNTCTLLTSAYHRFQKSSLMQFVLRNALITKEIQLNFTEQKTFLRVPFWQKLMQATHWWPTVCPTSLKFFHQLKRKDGRWHGRVSHKANMVPTLTILPLLIKQLGSVLEWVLSTAFFSWSWWRSLLNHLLGYVLFLFNLAYSFLQSLSGIIEFWLLNNMRRINLPLQQSQLIFNPN